MIIAQAYLGGHAQLGSLGQIRHRHAHFIGARYGVRHRSDFAHVAGGFYSRQCPKAYAGLLAHAYVGTLGHANLHLALTATHNCRNRCACAHNLSHFAVQRRHHACRIAHQLGVT